MATEVWELRISGYSGPEPNQSVQHFISDNVSVGDSAHDGYQLIASWTANVLPKWKALCASDYYVDNLEARRVIPKFSAVAHNRLPFRTVPGTFAGTSIANQVCPSIFLIPPMGIKSGGRIYLPSCPRNFILNNTHSAAAITALTNWGNVVTANFGTGALHWQQAIYSKKLNSASLVQAWKYSPIIGFQNRRRVFFGKSTTKKKPHV